MSVTNNERPIATVRNKREQMVKQDNLEGLIDRLLDEKTSDSGEINLRM